MKLFLSAFLAASIVMIFLILEISMIYIGWNKFLSPVFGVKEIDFMSSMGAVALKSFLLGFRSKKEIV